MTTPEKLQEFLASLAPITATNYQIRNQDGDLLYSANGNAPDVIPADTFHRVTRQIILEKGFLYNDDVPRLFLCGCPIITGAKTPAVLLAYGAATNGPESGHHRYLLKHHLQHTVALIEEN